MFCKTIILLFIFALRNTVLYDCFLFNTIKDRAYLSGESPVQQISSETVLRREYASFSILQIFCKMRNTEKKKAARRAALNEAILSHTFRQVRSNYALQQLADSKKYDVSTIENIPVVRHRKLGISLFNLNFKSTRA
jgi:hypothetical protein